MNNRTNMMKMGDHIAELRKKKGYTQKTLGDMLDVSDKTVCKWEKGIVAPDITILSSLASTLEVSVDEILSGEEVSKVDTIEAIDVYSNITKRKLIRIFIIFALFFALCTFFIFRIEEYYSWHLTPLNSNGDISSVGYLLTNNKESKLIIEKIFFNMEIPDDLLKIDFLIKNDNNTIYEKTIKNNDTNKILEILGSYSLFINYDKLINIKDIDVIVTIYSESDKKIYKISY